MEFSPERLTELRTALKITRAEAARMLNMSAMGYGRYEKGERTPSFQTVSYIAQIFNTSIDYLYGLSDEKAPGSIIVCSADDPDLFLLLQIVQKNKGMVSRLLEYAKEINKYKAESE